MDLWYRLCMQIDGVVGWFKNNFLNIILFIIIGSFLYSWVVYFWIKD